MILIKIYIDAIKFKKKQQPNNVYFFLNSTSPFIATSSQVLLTPSGPVCNTSQTLFNEAKASVAFHFFKSITPVKV